MSHHCRLLARTDPEPRRRPRPDPDDPLSIAECRQLAHATLPLVEEHLPLPRPLGAIYSSQECMAVLLLSDLERTSPEGAARRAHLVRQLAPSGHASFLPSADTSLAALHVLPTAQVEAGLQAALHDQVTHAVAQGVLPADQPLILAGDCHDILTYHRKKPRRVPAKLRPSRALPLAVGTKPELGTTLAYRFLTFQTTRGAPLTVHVDPFLPLESLPAKLTRGLDITEARLSRSIDLLLYDAGAHSNEVLLALQRRGTPFIIRASQNSRIAALLREHAGLCCFVLPDFPVLAKGNRADAPIATTTLVGLKREVLDEVGIDTPHTERDVRWFTFLTHLTPEAGESDRDFALRVVRLYKERWCVETGYRGHEELRGFTHALHYDVRLLQYFLAVILSNVWALQRWKDGETWTKRTVAEFLAFALLFGLHAEGGVARHEVQVSSRAVDPAMALGGGDQET
ncbi:MAG: hypothetical protein KGJ23_13785 [Euryarchaeota archaeon]|nr:hypothetical protein [Euryarchaeota archaeon]MDE1837668.1 hypothetical protein [Euryarchaeota archaeon]MDE1881812.1 hypothetical protein [Euryarchaeota archaeon]MDE2046349.1 hypothetical protein [Thermoplasmata archaeon]